MNNYTQHLGVFGWNWFFVADLRLEADSEGNITLLNSELQFLLPQQKTGTALYETNTDESPLTQLISSPYDLNLQALSPTLSHSHPRTFSQLADGSYSEQDTYQAILTWEEDHYQLQETDGTIIVFRPDGQLGYIEDANGYRLSTEYTDDQLTSLTSSNGDRLDFSYNEQGHIRAMTDQTGQTSSYTYDSTGQFLLSVEDSTGTTNYTYGNPYDPTALTSITNSDGTKTTYDYDEYDRLQQVIYGEGREALAYTYSYNDSGVTVIDPSGATTQQLRNDQGQISQTIDPLGRTTDYSYDEAGNLVGINGELGFSASFTYDEAGNMTSQTDALNQTVHFTYDAQSNNLSGFRDARGNDILYAYDSRGNLSSIIYEDGTQNKYFYDADGLLTKSVNRRGQEISYKYNDNYQVTKETHRDGSIIEYGYGATDGVLTFYTTNSSMESSRIDYDQANDEITIENSMGLVHTHKFDKLSRKTQITIQDGTNTYTTNYSYDSFGRLDKLTDGDGNLIVDYDYNAINGLLERETNGNGTYTTYSYDLAGQLISLVNSQTDGTVNSRFDYTYDNLGKRTELSTLDGTWSYSYDLTGQLTGAVFASTNPDISSQDLTYVYNAAGNRTQAIVNGGTENYSTNNLNQYESAGTTTYSYDLDGNLVSKVQGDQTWTYLYDDNNRLVEVVDSDNNLTQYEYDSFGNRTATIYNGQRTEYLIDPFGYGDVLAEYDADGNLVARYNHGIGLVSRTDVSKETAFYDFDGTGSTVGLTAGVGTKIINLRQGKLFNRSTSQKMEEDRVRSLTRQ